MALTKKKKILKRKADVHPLPKKEIDDTLLEEEPVAKKKQIASKPAGGSIKKAAVDSGTVEFTPYPAKSYSEEYQVTGFHYAFMSADGKMCHHWIKCRDFLQDALRNQLTGRKDQIYGFNYDPNSDPKCDTKTTRMLVTRKGNSNNAEFDEMAKAALTLVNYYEREHKLTPRSKIIKAKGSTGSDYVYLFQGPGVWSQGAVMIAMYTFLIRIGFFKPKFKDEASLMKEYERIIKDKSASNDTRYLKTVYKNLHLALEHREKHLFKKPGHKKGDKVLFHDSPMGGFHHHSGIVSLSMFNTPEKGLNDEFRKIFSAGK